MSDQPIPYQTYRLTGGTDDKCIANGNTWEESKVDMDKLAADLAAKKRKQLLEALED